MRLVSIFECNAITHVARFSFFGRWWKNNSLTRLTVQSLNSNPLNDIPVIFELLYTNFQFHLWPLINKTIEMTLNWFIRSYLRIFIQLPWLYFSIPDKGLTSCFTKLRFLFNRDTRIKIGNIGNSRSHIFCPVYAANRVSNFNVSSSVHFFQLHFPVF